MNRRKLLGAIGAGIGLLFAPKAAKAATVPQGNGPKRVVFDQKFENMDVDVDGVLFLYCTFICCRPVGRPWGMHYCQAVNCTESFKSRPLLPEHGMCEHSLGIAEKTVELFPSCGAQSHEYRGDWIIGLEVVNEHS
jgi:hypothetical protein